MRIQLFGGVSASDDRGASLEVGPAKSQALLATLALSPGAPVPVWRLVESVWGGEPPRTAERTLQAYVTRLRKSLGGETIVRNGGSYRLDVDADAVDVVRFQLRLDAGDVTGALDEWVAPPLAGLDAPGLEPAVEALTERWLGAVELDLERRLEQDAPAAIGSLTELTALHPFRERLWALLMTALYRVGRQADALAAYRTAREQLVEHLGVEPGPRLRELEAMILAQDDGLAVDPEPVVRAASRAGNLPRQVSRLVGREHDLDRLEELLVSRPLVTLVGPGGVGKTRLALAVAARCAGAAAWFVDLSEVRSPDGVTRAAAETLDVPEGQTRTLEQSLVLAIRDRDLLLVLDNCEHVVAGAARLASALVAGCPRVRILATSRERLGVADEQVVEIAPLDPSGSGVELFDERAAAVLTGYDVEADGSAVEGICRRLDGLPLAIELAAARMRTFAPAELLARLDDRFRVLTSGGRVEDGRSRPLHATIAWSYDLLEPSEQTLFRRLAVFTGGFDLAAVEAIASGAVPDVDLCLDGLVERSMVVAEASPSGRRFRLLETIRAFAADELTTSERDDAGRLHGLWCRDEVDRIGRGLAGKGELDAVRELSELWPNLRAAVERATERDLSLAVELVQPIASEALVRSRLEIGDWVERILLSGAQADETVVFGLTWAARVYALAQSPEGWERLVARVGEPDSPLVRHARAFVHEDYSTRAVVAVDAAAEARERGWPHLAELLEIDVLTSMLNLGRLDEADGLAAGLVDRYRVEGPPTCLNWALMLAGYTAQFQGDRDRADALFEHAVAVEVPPRTYSPNQPIEARVAFRHGRRREAFRILRDHVDELLETGNMHGGSIDCLEFVMMMAALDRVEDVALVLGYLETTGLLDAPGWRALIAHPEALVAAAGVEGHVREGGTLGDRGALRHVRDTLESLASGDC